MIYVIDDDEIMCECIAKSCKTEVRKFNNAIEAMAKISAGEMPSLIFLDVMLNGPNGFTFLNELVSYTDTAKIPIVVVSSLNFTKQDLSEYGVVGVLDKATMTPQEISTYAREYCTK